MSDFPATGARKRGRPRKDKNLVWCFPHDGPRSLRNKRLCMCVLDVVAAARPAMANGTYIAWRWFYSGPRGGLRTTALLALYKAFVGLDHEELVRVADVITERGMTTAEAVEFIEVCALMALADTRSEPGPHLPPHPPKGFLRGCRQCG